MTDQGNRRIYRLWAPVYDAILGGLFWTARRRVMELAGLTPGEQVLLIGVGTGADLPLLPAGVCAAGIDISPEMLAHAQTACGRSGAGITLQRASAQALPFADGAFDAAVLNLILSVVPDPAACLRETLRVLRPDGRIVIFDKFLPEHSRVTPGRRLLNAITTRLGTDITRSLDQIMGGAACTLISNEPGILAGMYRVALLRRT